MSNIFHRVFALAVMAATLGGCEFWNRSVQDVLNNPFKSASVREPAPLRMPSSVVVCRTKQCAPAKLSMSREYIYNSLLHLLDNNNRKKALVCQADAGTHACTETFVSLPITVGITPAYMYIDSVKITDVSIAKGNRSLNLILNYNVTYNGQTPDCKPAKSLLYVKNVNNIVALRGALFMRTLQDEVQQRGFAVAHIKTDSIKIPDATPEIIAFCMDFAKKYGYTFEHEATYERMCLVNNAVYIAKYMDDDQCKARYGYVPGDNAEEGGEWTATGTQFQVPYVFKTLFSKEPIEFSDLCETKSVA